MKQYQRPDMEVYSGQQLKDVMQQDRLVEHGQPSQQEANGDMPPFCISSAASSHGQDETMRMHVCVTNAAPPVSAEVNPQQKTTCSAVAVPPRCLTNAGPARMNGAVLRPSETAENPNLQK